MMSPITCKKCGAWTQRILKSAKGFDHLECAYCGTRSKEPSHGGFAHLYRVEKLRYPYVNGSLGCVVTSRAHEDAVAKKLGMVRTDHGTTVSGRRAKSTRKKYYRAAKV